jgi:hypothetical protein
MSPRTLYSLELDICAEYPITDLANDMSTYALVCQLINANGPGGGNPVYRFSSYNKDDLLAFAEACGYEDAEEFLEVTA